MTNVPQTRAELEAHLKEQIAFLKASAQSYDKGFIGEAKRLAATIRVLVHDTVASSSLLRQLDLKHISFYDTALDYDPKKYFHSFHGLTIMETSSSGGQFVARSALPRGEPLKLAPFDQWWAKVVVVDSHRNQFTRRQLVLTLANREGGTHVDPVLDPAYATLTRKHSMALSYRFNDKEGEFSGIEHASVRQIAHEVILSLEKGGPQYFVNETESV
jgi:hypothetical protein